MRRFGHLLMIIKEFVEETCSTCEPCVRIAAVSSQRCKCSGIVVFERFFF